MLEISSLKYQVILNWIAIGFYVISTVFFAYSISFQKEKALKPAMIMSLIGLIPHAIAIIIRWDIAGHGPYMAKYEILSSTAWLAIAVYLLVAWRYPLLKPIGVIVVPLSLLMSVISLFMSPDIRRLPPSLRSTWLIIHVVFNRLAAGSIIIALGTSVLYLLKENRQDGEFYRRLPSPDALDAYSYKFIGFGFISWSITIASGAIWANEVWGRYWGWDPIETWSLITWLLFGIYLHLRYFFKWQGRKAAWLMVLCFVFSALTMFVIPFVVRSLHTEYFR